MEKLHIVVLSAAPKNGATKSIINAGHKKGHKMTVLDPAFLYLLISDIENGYDKLYDGFDSNNQPIRIKAKDIDAVIPRIGKNLEYGCSVLEHLNYNLGIFATQNASGLQVAANKLLSLQRISQAKIKVPKTVIADNPTHVNWLIDRVGGLPAMFKILKGSQGIGVIPLESKNQTNATLESFYKSKTKFLLQEFIDGGATDIRAIVIDGKVEAAMERKSNNGDLRSNISLGGSGKKIELSEEEETMCIKAARACGLEVAGVDLMKSIKTQQAYIIEVNGNYGYHIEKITGIDISTPLIAYCERNAKKKVVPNHSSNNSSKAQTTSQESNQNDSNSNFNQTVAAAKDLASFFGD